MKHFIVAIYDHALDSYLRPFYTPALGAAIRGFQDEINRQDSEMGKHPDDYDLFNLGQWDDSTGKHENLEEPQQIAIGKQVILTKQ